MYSVDRHLITKNVSNKKPPVPEGGNPFSSPIFRFTGPSHEEGGIPIVYGNQPAEVEGGETGFIDNEGDLNIFGNMYVPGTNKKFKTLSKQLAVEEIKTNKTLGKAIQLFDNDPDDTFDRLKVNAGEIMGKSMIQKQKRLTQSKEQLADLQEEMLSFSNELGVSPKTLFGSKRSSNRIAQMGDVIPVRYPGQSMFQSVLPDYFQPPVPINVPFEDQLGQNLSPVQSINRNNQAVPLSSPQANLETTRGRSVTDNRTYPTSQWSGQTPIYDEPLGIGQIAPELYALATNRPEFVSSPTFNPRLQTPYQISFQDRINQNTSTFRQLAQSTNNPAALAQLAAQKYQADQSVLSEEFRTNQTIQNQILNDNANIINQAQLTNIGLNKQAEQERSQNLAATRATNRAALTSIASKSLQNKQYNRGLTLFNQLTPNYKYNADTGQWEFAGGQAPINVGGVPINPINTSAYGETRQKDYTRDSRGRLVRTQEQRSPGIMRLFRRS